MTPRREWSLLDGSPAGGSDACILLPRGLLRRGERTYIPLNLTKLWMVVLIRTRVASHPHDFRLDLRSFVSRRRMAGEDLNRAGARFPGFLLELRGNHASPICRRRGMQLALEAGTGCAVPVYNAARIGAQLYQATFRLLSEREQGHARRATAIGSRSPGVNQAANPSYP